MVQYNKSIVNVLIYIITTRNHERIDKCERNGEISE